MRKVRMGVVGVGGMGQGHCAYMKDIPEVTLAAVCDVTPALAKKVGEQYGIPSFTNSSDLLGSGLVDAVLIATPHFDHPPVAIDAFRRGIHVLSEKPIAVSVKEATRMIRAAEKYNRVFGVMFQSRTFPLYRAAKKLIDKGAVGEIIRTSLLLAMYRSQAYYNSAGWRATWKGEGGGVLLNQAPHGLDIFAWLAGAPKLVTAQTRTRAHNIEVEDEAFAVLEYANGAHGYIYASVDEVPQYDRMEIVGERGKILIEEEKLQYWEISGTISKFTRTSKEMWSQPECREVAVKLEDLPSGQPALTRNFCRAILKGEKLVAPGAEGLWSLELANAIILSSYRKKPVRLPVNRNEYETLLQELQAKSRTKKNAGKSKSVTDPRHKRK